MRRRWWAWRASSGSGASSPGERVRAIRASMILRAVPDRSLDELLAGTSRSFYLSLAVLPPALRAQLSVAYLVARAADTIADTRVVAAARRLELLAGVRAALADELRIVPIAAEVR